MNKKFVFTIAVGALLIGGLTFAGIKLARAETSGGSPESGVTSRIKTLYTALVTSLQGSDAAGSWGDWGAYWNRIHSATSYLPGSMINQQYHDSYGAPVTETTNYSLTWTTNPTPVTGDDNKAGRGGLDPRTGLTWSQYLQNSAGTVAFVTSSGSTWNWDSNLQFTVTSANATAGATYTNNGQTFTVVTTIAPGTSLVTTATGSPTATGTLTKASGTGDATITFSALPNGATNVAVGNKTAKLLCSDRGNGWRLPTQKELMQAYIDGSYFNLTNPSNNFWSATEYNSTDAWNVVLNAGYTYASSKSTFSNYVRCVR